MSVKYFYEKNLSPGESKYFCNTCRKKIRYFSVLKHHFVCEAIDGKHTFSVKRPALKIVTNKPRKRLEKLLKLYEFLKNYLNEPGVNYSISQKLIGKILKNIEYCKIALKGGEYCLEEIKIIENKFVIKNFKIDSRPIVIPDSIIPPNRPRPKQFKIKTLTQLLIYNTFHKNYYKEIPFPKESKPVLIYKEFCIFVAYYYSFVYCMKTSKIHSVVFDGNISNIYSLGDLTHLIYLTENKNCIRIWNIKYQIEEYSYYRDRINKFNLTHDKSIAYFFSCKTIHFLNIETKEVKTINWNLGYYNICKYNNKVEIIVFMDSWRRLPNVFDIKTNSRPAMYYSFSSDNTIVNNIEISESNLILIHDHKISIYSNQSRNLITTLDVCNYLISTNLKMIFCLEKSIFYVFDLDSNTSYVLQNQILDNIPEINIEKNDRIASYFLNQYLKLKTLCREPYSNYQILHFTKDQLTIRCFDRSDYLIKFYNFEQIIGLKHISSTSMPYKFKLEDSKLYFFQKVICYKDLNSNKEYHIPHIVTSTIKDFRKLNNKYYYY